MNKKYLYAASSFLAGFAVMTIELIASRLVAPIIGASVFTWTSVIGVTLLGLAVGSFIGGEIADRKNPDVSLPISFLISASLVALIPIFSDHTQAITASSDSILVLNLYLSIYLFLLPALAIGTLQPIILKKFADDFQKIGSKYGLLSFAWSAGGILGVMFTGFYFISHIGSRETVYIMAFILFLTGLTFSFRMKKVLLTFLIAFMAIIGIIFFTKKPGTNNSIIYQDETNYYDTKVADTYLPGYGNSRILALDFDIHSVEGETSKDYTTTYPIFGYLNKEIKDILVIGAGAYTMPKYFKDYYKDSKVSVIELDPELINIGNKFFNLKKYEIQTIIGDAKIIMNKDKEKHDLIFGDAYNSFISVPWYLLTQEWNVQAKSRLNKDGIYAINFIGALRGENSQFTEAVINTFKITFPNYYILALGENKEDIQNIVLMGVNGERPINEVELAKKLSVDKNKSLSGSIVSASEFSKIKSIILKDNFSPVEKLMNKVVQGYFQDNLFLIKKIFYES